jgi:hypothetical protein
MTRAGQPKTGGRQKGTPNRATAEVKALAQEWGEQAILTLGDIMTSDKSNEPARIAAARELLDRGYGKPRQGVDLDAAFRGASLVDALRSLNEQKSDTGQTPGD